MANIQVLDQNTINQIAAGEVIERPSSVVKELLENAIDAKATAVTVEIRDGGLSMIRVTDNGCGIPKEEIALAFKRHATSKIRTVEDLFSVASLGFRGEALSSIASVAKVELITKTGGSISGSRYRIEGGEELGLEEIGAPEGTTFIARDLFYNTPARRKFLKTPVTEGAHVADLVEKLALSHPEISIRYIQNKQSKLHTSGNHRLQDIIYTVFGREIAGNLVPVEAGAAPVSVSGYIGKPLIARGNRNFENYFINGRYIKSSIINKAIEEAYKPYMMQHKYPFTMLQFTIDQSFLDVNVHPAKMELRFRDGEMIYRMVYHSLSMALSRRELIPKVSLPPVSGNGRRAGAGTGRDSESGAQAGAGISAGGGSEEGGRDAVSGKEGAGSSGARPVLKEVRAKEKERIQRGPRPEPFETNRLREQVFSASAPGAAEPFSGAAEPISGAAGPEIKSEASREVPGAVIREEDAPYGGSGQPQRETAAAAESCKSFLDGKTEAGENVKEAKGAGKREKEAPAMSEKPKQLDLFEEKLLSGSSRARHVLLGQLFGTYWLVQFEDSLYIIDQHAAHEKVLYERTMKSLKTREYTSQMVVPPIILTLNSGEELILQRHGEEFASMGFEIEPFGGKEYAVRAVPANLFSIAKKDLLMEMIDGLTDGLDSGTPDLIREKIASMSCKAAVKGNHAMSAAEANFLIDELLTLENPYACPHGRPTIIAMSRRELEKKFKRIV
ncbi:DNA mismatch repair endonuclease MutL [Otoolea muris]|uniref:DNA mismatch repair endonuclease MutL n=1 Tax=Otoolea muris TaxID=2941515 RepID=UPI0020409914|nr:DNA mismatch repair endonuclease MutL [Otoolea muris]